MQLFLDTAELEEVRTGVQLWGVVSGVTTNPTLIAAVIRSARPSARPPRPPAPSWAASSATTIAR